MARIALTPAHALRRREAATVLAQLNAEINKALALPGVARQVAVEGATPMPSAPQAFGDLIRREIPRWAAVVKAGNVKPDRSGTRQAVEGPAGGISTAC